MDFDINKPSHIVSLLLVIASFFMIIGLSIVSLFLGINSEQVESIQEFPAVLQMFVEIFTVILQIIIFITFMIIVPLIWYRYVNKLNLKRIKERLQLDFKTIDRAFLWGILAFLMIIGLNIVVNLFFQSFGFAESDLNNAQDIANILSPIPMFVIIAFQPIGEEIFFRGFLLDKIDYLFNKKQEKTGFFYDYKIPAVLTTSILFGVAHLSYAKIPVFISISVVGFVLGIIVVKTKNLYSSIFAHMILNISAFAIYFMFKDLPGF